MAGRLPVEPNQFVITPSSEDDKKLTSTVNPFNTVLSSRYDTSSQHLAPFLLSMVAIVGRRIFVHTTYHKSTIDDNLSFAPLHEEKELVVAYFVKYKPNDVTRALIEARGDQIDGAAANDRLWVLFRINVDQPTALDEYVLYHLNVFFHRLSQRSNKSVDDTATDEPVHITNYIPLTAARILKKYNKQVPVKLHDAVKKLAREAYPLVEPALAEPPSIKSSSADGKDDFGAAFYANVDAFTASQRLPPEFVIGGVSKTTKTSASTKTPVKSAKASSGSVEALLATPGAPSATTTAMNAKLTTSAAAVQKRGAAPPAHDVGKSKKPTKKDTEAAATTAAAAASKPAAKATTPAKGKQTKPAPVAETEDVYLVEAIVKHKVDKRGTPSYLVKWQGYPHSDNTWETHANLSRTINELLEEYLTKADQTLYQKLYPKTTPKKK